GGNSAERRAHYDRERRFPLRHAKRQGGFAQLVWHQDDHFFGGARDQRNHDYRKGERPGERRKTAHRMDDHRIGEDAYDDRRNPHHHIGREPHGIREAMIAMFRQEKAGADSNRDADETSDPHHQKGSDNRVGHSPTLLTNWGGHVGEERPVQAGGTLEEE